MTEREEFEAFCVKRWGGERNALAINAPDGGAYAGEYTIGNVEFAWKAWQAARSTPKQGEMPRLQFIGLPPGEMEMWGSCDADESGPETVVFKFAPDPSSETTGAWGDLKDAAAAVVKRWETPLWKDVPATAEYIDRLRESMV